MHKFFDNTLTATSSIVGTVTDTVQEIGVAKFFISFSVVTFLAAMFFAY
ncbi:MAG: hypothetical protein PF495_14665 [Spirochaetales bacterium]|jgi:hypothetical protein|nr:hypothetical protein [Spirochaetales bacterium]